MPNQTNCNHKFVHLDTKRNHNHDGICYTHYVRIDTFFCEKCLTYENKKQEFWSKDRELWLRGKKPDWY